MIIHEPEATFKVTKIEEGESGCIVHCEFVEDEKPPVLEGTVKEFEGSSLELKGKTSFSLSSSSSGLKYAEPDPPSLSEILKLGSDYKAVTLNNAIRKAGFDPSARFIRESKEKKMKDLRRISKDFDLTWEDVMSVFIYTLEDKESRGKSPYNVVNSALASRSEESLLPLRDYIFYLLQGLRSLPRFRKQSVLYRGVKMAHSDVKEIYREGRTLTWTSFTSTSTDENKARPFAGKEGVIFEVHGKFRGYSIGLFSKFAAEEGNFGWLLFNSLILIHFDYFVAEIVLEPDTRFTVMMVEVDKEKPSVMRIVLDVKESEPALESELAKFKSACEELEEEEYVNGNINSQGECTRPGISVEVESCGESMRGGLQTSGFGSGFD